MDDKQECEILLVIKELQCKVATVFFIVSVLLKLKRLSTGFGCLKGGLSWTIGGTVSWQKLCGRQFDNTLRTP